MWWKVPNYGDVALWHFCISELLTMAQDLICSQWTRFPQKILLNPTTKFLKPGNKFTETQEPNKWKPATNFDAQQRWTHNVANNPNSIQTRWATAGIWKMLGWCGNTKRNCRNVSYFRNIATIPCNGHCYSAVATLQLRLHCCNVAIAAIHCAHCSNPQCLGALQITWKAQLTPPPHRVPETELWTKSLGKGEHKEQTWRSGGEGHKELMSRIYPWELVTVKARGYFGLGFSWGWSCVMLDFAK